jgi:Peptidase family M28
MEPVRLATSKRRPRRGSVERPVDLRIVRNLAAILVAPLFLLLVTMAHTAPLPAPSLPPAFDGATAGSLTVELAGDNANRVPGSPGAAGAAQWFRDKLALYGLPVREDVWREDVAGLGDVELRNLATVVRGTLPETIVIVAHRDNNGLTAGANSDASGTAALVELARAYATAGTTESARTPLHTLVFLSADAGAYGSLGVARFARHSPLAQSAVAVLSLDGIAGSAAPRLEIAGLGAHSPPPVLVGTASARVSAETGSEPRRPRFLDQLVSLGLPFGYGGQAPLLGDGIPALRLTTAPDAGAPPGGDEIATLDRARLTQLGRASETLLNSLDAAVELPTGADGAVYLGGRAIRGWALELLLVVAVVPFAGAALDLLSRCRRRRLALRPAWLALRRRFGLWLVVLAMLGGAAVAGALPVEPPLPLAPGQPPVDRWPVGAVAIGVIAVALVWARARARLIPRVRALAEEDLAAYSVAFIALLGVALLTAAVSPYSLVFVLPSLYAWLALPQLRRGPGWVTDIAFGIGLSGPVLALVVLGEQLGLGLRAPLYAASLLTTGVVPWGATLALTAWASVASFVGAIAAGRYTAPSGR